MSVSQLSIVFFLFLSQWINEHTVFFSPFLVIYIVKHVYNLCEKKITREDIAHFERSQFKVDVRYVETENYIDAINRSVTLSKDAVAVSSSA